MLDQHYFHFHKGTHGRKIEFLQSCNKENHCHLSFVAFSFQFTVFSQIASIQGSTHFKVHQCKLDGKSIF